ncbi:thiamine diphosphokinase [Lactobacillus jensenii]|jgi:thiamine diphosphokinase|uniref:Thiamine diphosphokinase n=2 Tax=Lactobacillus jensenii TaxID=109790 RepID=A0A5N1IG69_LACJE|nr:thiamine diphosphokinase [Lactobacillus jensenii]EEQ68853.1 thiamine diphosphokinase [Lactobacillus jensenii 1153]APT14555.1 thiamine diphosphokinase [Lactobacillus jensenii]EEQ24885.1 thiamine diphosphokinase [Lactobacillus jensenii 269-3]EEX27874.1 thiamine diphosphokinase [Lactobacillus jensenii SJ-7A-US]KAA9237022.1 thiamine diphosphokinase [Lactobacillus jensenii]
MKGISLLGGPLELIPEGFFEEQKNNNQLLLGVDRGSLFLVEKGLIPDLAIGDFDSLKKEELVKIEKVVKDIRYSNPVKDLTDSELMIKSAFENYHLTSLEVYGATGGRLDHFLVNLFTFLKPEFQVYAPKVTLIDRQNIIKFFLPGKHYIKPVEGYKYLGIVNLTDVENLSIQGAKYPLKDYNSTYPISFASNEFVAGKTVEIYFEKGTVAVIYSKDLDRFANI